MSSKSKLTKLLEQAAQIGFDLSDKQDRHLFVEWLIGHGVTVEEDK